MLWNWRAKAVIRISRMLLQWILDHLQVLISNLSVPSRGDCFRACARTSTAFSSAAWRFRPQKRRRKKLIYHWAWMRRIKKGDEQNLSPLDYHLQKNYFMINDSFVPERKKFILFLISTIHVHGMIIHWAFHILRFCLMSFHRFFPLLLLLGECF